MKPTRIKPSCIPLICETHVPRAKDTLLADLLKRPAALIWFRDSLSAHSTEHLLRGLFSRTERLLYARIIIALDPRIRSAVLSPACSFDAAPWRLSDGVYPYSLEAVVREQRRVLRTLLKSTLRTNLEMASANRGVPRPGTDRLATREVLLARQRQHYPRMLGVLVDQASGNVLSCILNSPQARGKLVSVEIECLLPSGTARDLSPLAVFGSDGSIECESGTEAVEIRRTLSAPRTPGEFPPGLLKDLATLRSRGVRFNKSCGLHVHVDVRPYTQPYSGDYGTGLADGTPDAWTIYTRLCTLSRWVKGLVPVSRRNNGYCRFESAHTPQDNDRYRWLNWCSVREHGTLEFRCQGPLCQRNGDADPGWPHRVCAWVSVCHALVAACSVPRDQWNAVRSRAAFLRLLPEPLRSWADVRLQRLAYLTSIDDATAASRSRRTEAQRSIPQALLTAWVNTEAPASAI